MYSQHLNFTCSAGSLALHSLFLSFFCSFLSNCQWNLHSHLNRRYGRISCSPLTTNIHHSAGFQCDRSSASRVSGGSIMRFGGLVDFQCDRSSASRVGGGSIMRFGCPVDFQCDWSGASRVGGGSIMRSGCLVDFRSWHGVNSL